MSKFSRSLSCVLVPLIAAGCSMTNLMGTEDNRPEPAPEPDYRRIVAEGVKPNLKENMLAYGPLEISPIRRTTRTQYGDWMVCVRGRRQDQAVYFGVFMREHRILNWGQAVIVDRCEAEEYEPLPPPPEPPPPPPPNKQTPPKQGR
jgi:hypothetical protein